MTAINRTLSGLIEETLNALMRPEERPYRTTVGATALASNSDTTLTIVDDDAVTVTTLLQGGNELMLVTGKTDDATPVFTVSRGYLGTPLENHATGSVLEVGPITYPRNEVKAWVVKAVRAMNKPLPNLMSSTFFRDTAKQLITMPSGTMQVYEVRHEVQDTSRLVDIGGWRFERRLPTTVASTGLAVRVPSGISDDDELIVTYQVPYTWNTSGTDTPASEDDTVDLPLGADDVVPLWAAAYGAARREVSRAELDRIEEWNQEQAIRAGVNLRLIRDLWGEVYRRLDEARHDLYVPRVRVYRKLPRII